MKKERDEGYSHVLKYTGIFGGVQGLNIIINLVRNKLIAVLLGPEGMGLASLFNTTVNFISQATNLGISFSAVKHVSSLYDENDEEKIAHFVKVVRVWSLITALIGMAVCVLVGPLLSDYTFSWGDHTLHFVLLSPAVGLLAITGGETAILKGARRLRSLATIQVYTIFAALVISVPLYYYFGQTAIVPVIVSLALVSMLLTIRYSYRLYPLRLSGSRGVLNEGMSMVK
ncbi:MAG: oligosaccharide flippase family protein, partial [Prevotella sp.]|nr:oligosaccharide flippase family protein [Prevotella sp.]